MNTGFQLFRLEQPHNLTHDDAEDQWDDLSLAQQNEYNRRAALGSSAATKLTPPPPLPPARPAPAAPPPAPKAAALKPPPAINGGGGGGSKKKPPNAFQLWKKEHPVELEDEEVPDLSALSDGRLRSILKLLEADHDFDDRHELLQEAARILGDVDPHRWARASAEAVARERWTAMSAEDKVPYTRRASELKAAAAAGDDDVGSKAKERSSAGGASSSAPRAPRKRPLDETDDHVSREGEAACPELGEGWVKRTKKRGRSSGYDSVYIAPGTGFKFKSMAKAREFLETGLVNGKTPVTEEDRAILAKRKNRVQERKARQKERLAAARVGLAEALKESTALARERALADGDEAASAEDDGPVGERPAPQGRLRMVADASLEEETMVAWAFSAAFGGGADSALRLSTFTPDAFAEALTQPGESTLLTELHTRLLKRLLADASWLRQNEQLPPPIGTPMLLQQVPPPEAVTPTTWPEVLRCVGWLIPELHEGDDAHHALQTLQTAQYDSLDTREKLALLRLLEDKCLNVEELRDRVSSNAELRGQAQRAYKEREAQLKKEFAAHLSARAASIKRDATADGEGGEERVNYSAAPPLSDVDSSDDDDDHPPDVSPDALQAWRADRAEKRTRTRERAEATSALLEAIRKRDRQALADCIDIGSEMGLTGTHDDGRPWATDAMRAALKVDGELRLSSESVAGRKRLRKRITDIFNKHLETLMSYPVREEPIGVDSRGNQYFFFFADRHRLWVVSGDAGDEVPPNGGAATRRWAYYDTAASVEAVLRSLDGRPTGDDEKTMGCEAQLKARLRELLPIITAQMDAAEEEGWRTEGHEWLGVRLLRYFEGSGISFCRVTRWLPAQGESGGADICGADAESAADMALFHVVHEADGDQEDLDEAEVRIAIAALERHEAGEGEYSQRQPVYVNRVEKKAQRIGAAQLGLSGLRVELLELEEQLASLLRRIGHAWDSADGARGGWLVSCRNSESLLELAQLLDMLEETVYGLQQVPDVSERKPWRVEGHGFLGRQVRRFFEGYGISDGVIVGWLPAEGDDAPLWHIVHGADNDEEDLDETEARFALSNHAQNLLEMCAEEREYNEKLRQKWDAEADEPSEGDDWSAAVAVAARGAATTKARLWLSAEGRTRWKAALQAPTSTATVALAAVGLRAHCSSFAPLGGKLRNQQVQELRFEMSSWYHAAAFVNPAQLRGR